MVSPQVLPSASDKVKVFAKIFYNLFSGSLSLKILVPLLEQV